MKKGPVDLTGPFRHCRFLGHPKQATEPLNVGTTLVGS